MSSENQFSAKAASLGYAYQFRYALLLGLKGHQTGVDWSIALEAADDLEYTSDSDAALLQLKHRGARTSLTSGSADLWKTLRVWSEALRSETLRLPGTRLVLVTTSIVGPDTVCARLTTEPHDRDNAEIADELRSVAEKSRSTTLEAAHASYLCLTDEQQRTLVSAIRILGESPDIEHVDHDIQSLARLMVRSTHLEGFLQRLEGWWNRKCLYQLVHGIDEAVQGVDFDAFLSELREQFHDNNLPIDDDVADERPEIEPFLDKIFCQQLDLIDLGVTRLAIAVRDYHRAFVQRSRWSHLGLLRHGELAQYERQLREAWELIFERAKEELGSSASDDMKLATAKKIYAWAEDADFPIRPACTEGFVSRGSLHMLADQTQVGWHPDFEMLLAAVFDVEMVETA